MNTKEILKRLLKNRETVHYPKPKFFFEGQPGGKWLGTSYFYRLLKDSSEEIKKRFEMEVFFICPKTVIIQTDLFKEFMDQNDLWDIAYSEKEEQQLKQKFLEAQFNSKQKKQLVAILEQFADPITVRSSSLNEDSERFSFAGIFYSVILPNDNEDFKVRLYQLEDAIKLVYFSQYSKKAKEFYGRLNILGGDERMAIVIQQVTGQYYNRQNYSLYYPELSFVSFSYNEYATDQINPFDGYYKLAMGLGVGTVEIDYKTAIAVNIGKPNPIVGLNTPKDIATNSPKYFYALNLKKSKERVVNEGQFLLRLPLEYIDKKILERHGSYYDEDFTPLNFLFNDKKYFYYADFRKSINKQKIGINSTIEFLRDLLRENFEKDVDFEGSIDIIEEDNKRFFIFYPLQARFQVVTKEARKEKLPQIEQQRVILKGSRGIGKGEYEINIVVYVATKFSELYLYSNDISAEIAAINIELKQRNLPRYLLITPGRFGTQEKSVGVVGDFSTISHANAIIEVLNETENLTSSQGTHFFEDVRAVGMAYLSTKEFSSAQKQKLFEMGKILIKTTHCFVLEFDPPLKLELDKNSNYILFQDYS
ncbi:MAG: PEP/pyruvate-binding domain-containing protein [Candidatus Anstonellaceae archaeon]